MMSVTHQLCEVLLGFADALFQLTHSSFSKTAQAYGLLGTDYCAKRGHMPVDAVCDSFNSVWCTEIGCDALREHGLADDSLRPLHANRTAGASDEQRRSKRRNRKKKKSPELFIRPQGGFRGWLAAQILEGSFSAVSKPIFATKYLFFSIFRDLQDS